MHNNIFYHNLTQFSALLPFKWHHGQSFFSVFVSLSLHKTECTNNFAKLLLPLLQIFSFFSCVGVSNNVRCTCFFLILATFAASFYCHWNISDHTARLARQTTKVAYKFASLIQILWARISLTEGGTCKKDTFTMAKGGRERERTKKNTAIRAYEVRETNFNKLDGVQNLSAKCCILCHWNINCVLDVSFSTKIST